MVCHKIVHCEVQLSPTGQCCHGDEANEGKQQEGYRVAIGNHSADSSTGLAGYHSNQQGMGLRTTPLHCLLLQETVKTSVLLM